MLGTAGRRHAGADIASEHDVRVEDGEGALEVGAKPKRVTPARRLAYSSAGRCDAARTPAPPDDPPIAGCALFLIRCRDDEEATVAVSLYERLGGEAAIMAAVDLFYAKVIADDLLKPYFARLDMTSQSRKQVAFMTWAFGGPSGIQGRDLRTAHASLVKDQGLADMHFDAVAKYLASTLKELGVADALIQEAVAIVAGTRAQVLGR